MGCRLSVNLIQVFLAISGPASPKETTDAQGQVHREQVVATFKQVEAGRQIKDICHELGVSNATYYGWKYKCGGMDALERLAAAILLEAMQAPPELSAKPNKPGNAIFQECER